MQLCGSGSGGQSRYPSGPIQTGSDPKPRDTPSAQARGACSQSLSALKDEKHGRRRSWRSGALSNRLCTNFC